MLISIVADIHIDFTKYEEFEKDRFFKLIYTLIADDSDTVIFAGDTFNRNTPSLKEVRALQTGFDMLYDGGKTIYVIDGNHEGVTKLESTFDYIPFRHITYVKHDVITFEGCSALLCSWTNIGKLLNTDTKADILISHYRREMPGLYSAEIDQKAFEHNFKDIILGDIHSRYIPDMKTRYTSSPYTIHFSKNPKASNNGYIQLHINNMSYDIKYVDLSLPQKHKIDTNIAEYNKGIGINADWLTEINISGPLLELKKLGGRKIKNVRIKLFPDVVHMQQTVTIDPNVTFLDSLVAKVCDNITVNKDKVKHLLLNINGGKT